MRDLYVVLSVPLLLWLVISAMQNRADERRVKHVGAQQAAEYLIGAAQESSRALEAAEKGQPPTGIREHLFRAEVAVHEFHVSFLWFQQATESGVAYSFLSSYADELRALRERLMDANALPAEAKQRLAAVSHDLGLIQRLYTVHLLQRAPAEELASIRHQLSQELRLELARDRLRPAPRPTSP